MREVELLLQMITHYIWHKQKNNQVQLRNTRGQTVLINLNRTY